MNTLAIKKKIGTDIFVEKREKIQYNFANFPKQKMSFTEEAQTKHWSEKTCPVCKDKFIQEDKNGCKVRGHYHYMVKHWQETCSICNLC